MKRIFVLLFLLGLFGQMQAQTVFLESFNGTTTPTGWQQSATSGGPWVFTGAPGYSVSTAADHTGNGGNFAWMDFSGTDAGVVLETPVIDVSTLTAPTLRFFHESHYDGSNGVLSTFNFLYVEAWDGTTWQNVATLQGNTPFGWDEYIYNVTSFTYASGNSLRLRFRAESGGLSNDYLNDLLLDDIEVLEMPTCLSPNTLTAANLTGTSADLSWVDPNGASVFQVEYGPMGFALGTGTSQLVTNNPFSIAGLTPVTDYQFYVRAICGPGDTSVYANAVFTTPCASYVPIYSEDFTSYTPTCWEEARGYLSNSTTLSYGTSNWGSDGFANNGFTGSAKMNIYGTGRNEWLVSPSIDLGAGGTAYQLEYDIALTDFSSTAATTFDADDSLVVVISTNNGTTWSLANTLAVYTAGSEPSNVGDRAIINLSAYTGLVRIGFYATSTVSGVDNDVFIDNFLIQPVPSCPAPTALAANNVLGTSADFAWTDNAGASQWEVEYGPAGFVQGSGTTVLTGTNPYSATSLTPNSNYAFYVRAICGAGDSSTWTGPRAFTTPCATVVAPWFDDVENHTGSTNWTSSECWTTSPTSGFTWDITTTGTTSSSNTGALNAASGDNYFFTEASSGSNGSVAYLNTPIIDLSALTNPTLEFKYHMYGATMGDLTVEVNAGSGWQNIGFLLSGQQQSTQAASWRTAYAHLGMFTGQTVEVRFSGTRGSSFTGDICLDDIRVKDTCVNLTLNTQLACGSYSFGGTTLTTSGLYFDTLTNVAGCDSISVLDLTVNTVSTTTTVQTVCDTLTWRGVLYDSTGVYTDTLTSVLTGCDSLVVLDLTVNKSSNSLERVQTCISHTWQGNTYTTSGMYYDTIPNAVGCDSFMVLDLAIVTEILDTVPTLACDSFVWNGVALNTTGVYLDTFASVKGCDSIVFLDLTISTAQAVTVSDTACDVYMWNGVMYNTSGMYMDTLVNFAGCDSVVTLNLTIFNSTVDTVQLQVCDSLVWNGNVYDTSGMYVDTLTSIHGCDSVVYVDLTVDYTVYTNFTRVACDSFLWRGMTYVTSGMYYDTATAVTGCDSVLVLDLTINNSTSTTQTVSTCGAYFWTENNVTYTNSGQYMVTYTSSLGCDSMVILDLTINRADVIAQSVAVCDSYTWASNGQTYTTSGIYVDSFSNAVGCDSIRVLNLTINQITASIDTVNAQSLTALQTAAGYQWINCDNNAAIPGANAQVFTPAVTGNYAVVLTSATNCTDTSNCITVTVDTTGVGVAQLATGNTVRLYPNPTSGSVNIELEQAVEMQVRVMNIEGRVLEQSPVFNQANYQLNLPYAPGVYFVEIISEEQTKVFRIIKQ